MIKYKIIFPDKIEKVEISRETDRFVFFKTDPNDWRIRKERKESKSNYFDTWRDAHIFLYNSCDNKIESLEKRLYSEKERFRKILLLEEPQKTPKKK